MMNHIINVTVPRSGHHWLQKILFEYFNPGFPNPITDFTGSFVIGNNVGYCEFYKHCRQRPCPIEEIRWQKNHDFTNWPLEYSKDINYIVQFRNPIESVVSWYKFRVAYHEKESNLQFWFDHCEHAAEYWSRFRKNWIDRSEPNILKVPYEHLIADTPAVVIKCIKMFDENHSIDQQLLNHAVNKFPYRKRSDLTQFEFYDHPSFQHLIRHFERQNYEHLI